LVIVKHKKLVE